MEMEQLREAMTVMKAQDINVVDLPATPVRLLAFGVRYTPTWLSKPLIAGRVASGRGGKMPSFHIDLHSGQGKSEVAYLNGAVARHGARLRIPTPVNQWLNDTLYKLILGEMPLETYFRQPGKLLSAIRESTSAIN
jgi:2-dehydropantoate 2-reductase